MQANQLWRVLWSPLGLWRTQLFWRGFAVVVLLQNNLHVGESVSSLGGFLELPVPHRGLLLSAVLLLVAGSRLATLLALAGSLCAVLVPITLGGREQVADEFFVFMLLPIMSILLAALCLHRCREWFEDGPGFSAALSQLLDAVLVAVLRISLLVTLSFAFLHKLNRDFLDPEVSCGPRLSRRLSEWWESPLLGLFAETHPLHTLAGEFAAPLLLLLAPRLGILATVLIFGLIGHIGPVQFTLCMICLSGSFFRHEDGEVIRRSLRRYGTVLVALLLLSSAGFYEAHVGPRDWLPFHVLEVAAITYVFLVAAVVLDGLRGGVSVRGLSIRAWLGRISRDAGLFPAPGLIRRVLIALAVLSVLNGMSPYFGIKYRFSYAMLSNLRADRDAWNSLVFPEWLYLREHDPFVHVQRVGAEGADRSRVYTEENWSRILAVGGLYSPRSFKSRVRFLDRHDIRLRIQLTYQGEEYTFRDALRDDEFRSLVRSMPSSRMFQDHLTIGSPQWCTH